MNTEKKKKDFMSLVSDDKPTFLEKLLKEKEERVWRRASAKIALQILEALNERAWTQADLADKLGVSAAYVSKLVKGNENLTLETICKLQEVLGIQILAKHENPNIEFDKAIKLFKLAMKHSTSHTKLSATSFEIEAAFSYITLSEKSICSIKTEGAPRFIDESELTREDSHCELV